MSVEDRVDLVGTGVALVEVPDLGHVEDDVVSAVVGVVLDHVGGLAFAQDAVLQIAKITGYINEGSYTTVKSPITRLIRTLVHVTQN